MNRLKMEIETKRKELAVLCADVKSMEKKVTTRNDSCKPQALPTVSIGAMIYFPTNLPEGFSRKL